jgi:uncharacterized integral membrane protein
VTTITKIKLVALILAVGIAALLLVQNSATVETRLLMFTIPVPQAVLVLISFGLGLMTGILLTWSLTGRSTEPDA